MLIFDCVSFERTPQMIAYTHNEFAFPFWIISRFGCGVKLTLRTSLKWMHRQIKLRNQTKYASIKVFLFFLFVCLVWRDAIHFQHSDMNNTTIPDKNRTSTDTKVVCLALVRNIYSGKKSNNGQTFYPFGVYMLYVFMCSKRVACINNNHRIRTQAQTYHDTIRMVCFVFVLLLLLLLLLLLVLFIQFIWMYWSMRVSECAVSVCVCCACEWMWIVVCLMSTYTCVLLSVSYFLSMSSRSCSTANRTHTFLCVCFSRFRSAVLEFCSLSLCRWSLHILMAAHNHHRSKYVITAKSTPGA